MEISYRYTKVFPDFQVDLNNYLGKGVTSIVYKAYYNVQSKFIAAKLFTQQRLNPIYFDRQIQVLEKLTQLRNPYLMTYYGSRKTQMGLFLLLQYCKGGSLGQYIKKNKKISQLKVMTMFGQILQAMTALNQANIIHRDLKPDNILLNQNDCIKIADYGWAREINQKMTQTLTNGTGTPLYSAPQILFEKSYDNRSDVWSAGLILYQMLTGKHYFQGIRTIQELKASIEKMEKENTKIKYNKDIDPQWEAITNKMLIIDYKKRPTFAQVLNYFKEIEEKLFESLYNKYENPLYKSYMKNIDLSNSINPYNGSKGKEQQQKSHLNYSVLVKYFYFIEQKYEYVLYLLKKQKLQSYNHIQTTQKYILWFLMLSTYITKLNQLLQQIKDIRFVLPDRILERKDFSSNHMQMINQFLRQKQQQYYEKMRKKFLYLKQNINKVISQYQKTDRYNTQISQLSLAIREDLFKVVNKTNQQKFNNSEFYLLIFKKLIDSQPAFLMEHLINKLQQSSMQTYLILRTVGNLHKVFNEKKYLQEDYINLQKKEILRKKSTKEQIQMIIAYNN